VAPVVLWVEPGAEADVLHGCRVPPRVVPTPFAALTPGLVERARPRAVVFGLFTAGLDAFQIVRRLERIGWRGRVLVLTAPLPNPRMVEQELRGQAPALRLRLIALPGLPAPPGLPPRPLH
jgi:hypothetical protein